MISVQADPRPAKVELQRWIGMNTSSAVSFAEETSDAFTNNYVLLAAFALSIYDPLLTLREEVDLIWMRKLRLGAALYVLARYGTILYYILDVLITVHRGPTTSTVSCSRLQTAVDVFNMILAACVQGLILARIYAICTNRRWIALLAIIPSIGYFCGSLVQIVIVKCNSSGELVTVLGAIIGFSSILFDLLVFVITAVNTWALYRLESRLPTMQQKSLTELVFRQGTLRFGFIFLFIIVGIVTQETLRPTIAGVDVDVEIVMSTILICRFHLELVKRNGHLERGDTASDQAAISQFHAAIRDFGAGIDAEFGDHDTVPSEEQIIVAPDAMACPKNELAPPVITLEFEPGLARFGERSISQLFPDETLQDDPVQSDGIC